MNRGDRRVTDSIRPPVRPNGRQPAKQPSRSIDRLLLTKARTSTHLMLSTLVAIYIARRPSATQARVSDPPLACCAPPPL